MGQWLNGCEICNNGLIAEMNSLINTGVSVNKAATILAKMAAQRIGDELYTAEAIRARYRLHTNQREPHPQNVGHSDQPKTENLKKNNKTDNLEPNAVQQNNSMSKTCHQKPDLKEFEEKIHQLNQKAVFDSQPRKPEAPRPQIEELGADYLVEKNKAVANARKPQPTELEIAEQKIVSAARCLEQIIAGEIKDNGTDNDRLTAASIVRHGPGIIMSFIQLGIDVFKVHEFYTGKEQDGNNIKQGALGT